MPRVDGHREIHALYGPTARKAAFPDASWAFLVRVARNLAAAFDAVHRHGHVIGDVNQGNVVVSRKATVRLIDCDSFQVTHVGHTYPCRVGVPLFTPPELQGQRLDCVLRTHDHDRFGLAVLVFQLLFMGRHPFTGRHRYACVPVETAIREGLFAFGQEARGQGWAAPAFLALPRRRHASRRGPLRARVRSQGRGRRAAPDRLRTGSGSSTPSRRSSSSAATTRGTRTRATGGSCPWCRIENDGGPSFFFLAQGSAPDAFDLAATWKAIESVLSPGEAPLPHPPPAERPRQPRGDDPRPSACCRRSSGVLSPRVATREREDGGATSAGRSRGRGRASAASRTQWKSLCGDGATSWPARRSSRRRRRLSRAWRSSRSASGRSSRRASATGALPDHLRTFALEFARIPGLGPAEVARLAGRGITTAADIAPERLLAIPHVDLDLVRGLLLFRVVTARTYVFDPVTGIPGKDRKALEDWQAQTPGRAARDAAVRPPLPGRAAPPDAGLARRAGARARRRPPEARPAPRGGGPR